VASSVSLTRLLKEAWRAWQEDSTSEWSAALAFFTLLSLAPALVFIMAIAGFVFGEGAARGEIIAQVSGLVGPAGAGAIQAALSGARQRAGLATVVGAVTLLVSATAVFAQLSTSLNRIWRVPPAPASIGSFIKVYLRQRLFSFLMIVAIGFLLLFSLLASTVLALVASYLRGTLPVPAGLLQAVNFAISFGLITVLFAMIYHFLPDRKSPWRVVWLGAMVTSLLFTLGQSAIAALLTSSRLASAYGAASSLAVFLLWIYYSAQIFFLGAEITAAYARLALSAEEPPA
jgi:membrane protein